GRRRGGGGGEMPGALQGSAGALPTARRDREGPDRQRPDGRGVAVRRGRVGYCVRDRGRYAGCPRVLRVCGGGGGPANLALPGATGRGHGRLPWRRYRSRGGAVRTGGRYAFFLRTALPAAAGCPVRGTEPLAPGEGRRMNDYHINVFYSEDGECYVADIPDLKYCTAFGATPVEAVRAVEKAKKAWLR